VLDLTPTTRSANMAQQARIELLLITMAKASVKARAAKTPKFSTRVVRRCFRCGRKRGYMRDFELCRICFREYANEGQIPGVKKSSW
jgi:small subunit ribosomal protein S14